jgi:hypothetical protein
VLAAADIIGSLAECSRKLRRLGVVERTGNWNDYSELKVYDDDQRAKILQEEAVDHAWFEGSAIWVGGSRAVEARCTLLRANPCIQQGRLACPKPVCMVTSAAGINNNVKHVTACRAWPMCCRLIS